MEWLIDILDKFSMELVVLLFAMLLSPPVVRGFQALGEWLKVLRMEYGQTFEVIYFFVRQLYVYGKENGILQEVDDFFDGLAEKLDKQLEEVGFASIDVPEIMDNIQALLKDEFEELLEENEAEAKG